MECHRHIYEGFVERDKEKLKEWLSRDLKWAADSIVPYLEKSGEKKS
jgi:DNA-binding GntR family transcriptional regulator